MALVCPSLRLIFVHAPRTAGSAVAQGLRRWVEPGPGGVAHVWGGQHGLWHETRRHAEPFLREGWKLLSVLRDPWDRAASFYALRGGGADPVQWVERRALQDGLLPACLHDGGRARYLRFERLDEDFEQLCGELGIDNHLPPVRPTERRPKEVFPPEALSAIGRMLRWDAEAGYYLHPSMRP